MSKRYRKTPSELLSISDEYTAYCFDEACAYIMGKLDAGGEIIFRRKYTSFHDIYSQYEGGENY